MNNTAAQTPAARTQRFSSKSLSMGSLGIDQARYVIPVYQRPYAWTSVQVSQLMQDLLDFCRSPDIQSTYSLGTINRLRSGDARRFLYSGRSAAAHDD